MAIFYPKLKDIKKLKQKPTQGELHALSVLKDLSDEYEIYFQPFINGNNPDIIVMREDYGVLVIEVKDWKLENYIIKNDIDNWVLKKENIRIKSPIRQVLAYKDDLYNLSIPSLLNHKIKNKKNYGIVHTAIYFHNENSSVLKNEIKNDKFCPIYGKNNFTTENISKYSLRRYKNNLFHNDIYKEFNRVLKPSFHTLEQTRAVKLSKKQSLLAKSSVKQQKIRGVAGSGKTLVLAQRAVNSHMKHGEKVLILTYNITLRNYIHDNISRVRQEFCWSYFYINHYHAFIVAEANNYQITDFSIDDIGLFEHVEHKIIKYKSIFIDEIQDYKEEWIRIIKKYFLADDGEFVVFGDEKQNIYDISLTNKKPNTTIKGAWSKLDQSFRLSNEILRLAENFQSEFFSEKYELDKAIPKQQSLDLEGSSIEYYNFGGSTLSDLTSFINDKCKKHSIQPQDICILAHTNKLLRDLDYKIRKTTSQKTYTTFETHEMYEHLKKTHQNDIRVLRSEIKNIQRNKRYNFWMNAGGMKLSTIHSFKGWEVDTLFLIIDNNSNFETDEIIYTALTRCRNRLFLLNINNAKYEKFFIKNLDKHKYSYTETIVEPIEKVESEATNDQTLEQIIDEDNTSNFRYSFSKLYTNGKFNMLVLGEIASSNDKIRTCLNNYFSKFGIRTQEWDVDFWSNKDIKNKDLRSLKQGQSKYDLLITAQIHQHSSKGNKQGNLLSELMKPQYIKRIYGSSPKKVLTTDVLIDKIDAYIQRKT